MERARRPTLVAVAICCTVLLVLAPVATATAGSQTQNESNSSAASDAPEQRVTTCFTGSGTEFTIGAEN
ncbi:hypothetical protein [Natrinema sp. 1APR25-10V2]|uniref:DUF7332 family protein n=1 Tax=Natrinema sp. 1APR25-10V2 TaxID=2951081 RepID=UPI002875EEEB|nr:hypothetical protein [Natrinema sp. 1APR25-10V2]MDS0477844.1 hypothetical protein [Natrinema sp. 1APR25-10V2]